MTNRFPTVGIIGAGHLARMMVAPAAALGIDLLLFAPDAEDPGAQIAHHVVGDYTNLSDVLDFAKKCDVVTLEHDLVPLSVIKGLESLGVKVYPSSSAILNSQASASKLEQPLDFESEIVVMVARSPHGQATSWAPVETLREDGICTLTITPAQKISSAMGEEAQKIALEFAQAVGVVGVMAVGMFIKGEGIYTHELTMHPHSSGCWSIEGAVTSQFEQHLRAILDLPLGSPAMNFPYVVMGNVVGGDKTDMYRPYLHLMARSPSLHFHQYRNNVIAGRAIGHVTACGDDLQHLTLEVEHARDYMSGVIDE